MRIFNGGSTAALHNLFYVVFDRIVPVANKYMATLFNTSATATIMVERIFRLNWQSASVADDVLDQYLVRITARTTGTAITIRSGDTTDAAPAGVTADTGSTAVTEDHIVRRVPATSSEFQLDSNLKNLMAFAPNAGLIYERLPTMKGLVLRANQGLSMRNISAITTGSVSYVFEFTEVYG